MLKFAKGGSKSKSPVRTPDTLTSTDTVEILLGISEGPIKGLADGAKSFRVDDTPLENTNGKANFQNFELDVWPGSELGHEVTLDLGGFSSPLTVGVSLAKNIPVVRAGQVAGINAVDFRVVVQQLLKQNDKGIFTNKLSMKFEVKKTTDAAWSPAWISEGGNVPSGGTSGGGGGTGGMGGGGGYDVNTHLAFQSVPIDNGDHETWRSYGRVNDVLTFEGDIQGGLTDGPPVDPPADPDLPAVAVDQNTDDIYHWESGTGTWQPQTPPPSADYRVLNDGRRMYNRSETPPAGARPGDLWLKLGPISLILGAILVWNGVAWVKTSEYQANNPPTYTNGVWTIDEKVSSATPKDIRVFLPNAGPDDMWEYRVTKLSDDSGTENISEVAWESVQEVNRNPMVFHGVAMARVIGRASDQFTSLPQWNGDWLGRVVKVASNYDPVARTYTGIWDGTYKLAWTDNNAWIFQDFVENTRYGLSSVFPHIVNKWKIYEFAQHCDTMVLRPDGSLRPRWTYNDYVQEPRDAKEMAQYIAGSAGAKYVDDGNGVVEVIIDKDDPAVAIFTLENVGEDGFNYSYSDRLTRANEITVEFVNPTLNWQNDKRLVRDEVDIATFGRIPENFVAVGCIDVDEAIARGRRRLIGGLTEKEFVSFSTNRKGKFLAEWNVILVGDPEMGRGMTGRIRAVTGARSVSLRDPISFEPGIEYWASFDIVNPDYPQNSGDPFRVERRLITNAAGNAQTSLTFASDLPALPEYAAFIIEAPDVAGFPKPYRITNIQDDSGTGDNIRITALELNRNKWPFIDTGEDQGVITYSTFSSGEVLPAANPVLNITTRLKGAAATRVIEIRWDKSPSQWVRRYKVFHSVDGVPKAAMEATGLSVEVEGVESGVHTFAIVAIDIRGRESPPLTLSHNVTGEGRPVAPPTDLRLVGGLTATIFEDLSPKVAWTAPEASPNFKGYVLVISSTATGVERRTIELGADLEYRYDFLANKEDGGGTPERALTYNLFAVDQDGNLSPPVSLNIINPAPAAPAVTAETTIDGFTIKLSPSTDRDVVGALLWVSTTPGFNPLVIAPSVDGNQQSFPITSPEDAPRYVRAAYYDKFSKAAGDLFLSAEISTRTAEQVGSIVGTVRGSMNIDADFAAVDAALATAASNLSTATSNLNTAIGEVDTRLTGAVAATDAAAALLEGRVSEVELDIDDPTTGLKVRVGSVETATTDQASRLSVVEQQVQTPTTGLLARAASLETATANLQTGKADASRVTTLEASMTLVKDGVVSSRPERIVDGGYPFLKGPLTTNALVPADIVTLSGFGLVRTAAAGGAVHVQREPLWVTAGRTYEVTAEVYLQTKGSGTPTARAFVYAYTDPAAASIGSPLGTAPATMTTAGQSHLVTQRFAMAASTGVVALTAGTLAIRPGVIMQADNTSTVYVKRVRVEDVTDAVALEARATTLETATANLQTGKADASRVTTLETQVQQAGTGLLSRTTSLETATSDLQTGKADASRVTALEATVNTPTTGLSARTATLETATANLQTGKADATRVTTLEATITRVASEGRIIDSPASNFTLSSSFGNPVPSSYISSDARGYYVTFLSSAALLTRQTMEVRAGRVYKGRASGEQLTAADTYRWLGYAYDAAGALIGAYGGAIPAMPVGSFAVEDTFGLAGSGATIILPAGTVALRAGLQAMRSSGTGSVRIRELYVEDASDTTTLAARTTTLETATANLETGKADASRVTTVEATLKQAEAATLPYDFRDAGRNWINSYAGEPGAAPGADGSMSRTFPTLTGLGVVMALPVPVNTLVDTSTRGVLKARAGARYKLEVRGRRVAGSTNTATVTAYIIGLTEGWVLPAAPAVGRNSQALTLTTLDQWYTASVEISGDDLLAAGCAWVRGTARMSAGAGGASNVQVEYCRLTEITDAAALSARTTTLETATANLQTGKADATRVTTLEAQVGGLPETLLKNPMFARYSAPDGAPDSWTNWSGLTADKTRVAGVTNTYAMQMVGPAGVNAGVMQYSDVGMVQDGQWVVTEAIVRLDTGTFVGAGVLNVVVPAATTSTLHALALAFSSTPDQTGVAPGNGVVGRVYRFSHVWQVNAGATASRMLTYAMAHYSSSFGAITSANQLTWFLCHNRLATPAEVETLQARAGFASIAARFTSAEAATTSLQTGKADASRVTALETTINTAGTGLSARTASLETATSNLQTGKADASRVTLLEATASSTSGAMNRNPMFSDWPVQTSQTPPTGWIKYSTSTNSVLSRVEGLNGSPNAVRSASVGVDPCGIQAASPYALGASPGGEYVVVEADFTLVSGDLNGSGIYLNWRTAGASVGALAKRFSSVADASGVVRGAGVPGSTYRYRFLMDARGTGVDRYLLYGMTRWATIGPVVGAVTLDWHKLAVRAATPEEIAAGVALPALTARVATEEQATADLYGRTMARWAQGTAVPGAATFIEARSENVPGQAPSSDVGIGAKVVAIYNAVGEEWKKALEVANGNVVLSGGLQAGAFIRLGNGQGWPVALKAVDFNAADGEAVSFGTDLGALPSLTFAMNNLAPLTTGETYDVKATNLTATGFTLSAKINIPATPTSQSVTSPDTAVTISGYSGYSLARGALPDSADGTYTVSANGQQDHFIFGNDGAPEVDNEDYATITLRVYAKKAGVWTLVATVYAESMADPDDYPGLFKGTVTEFWNVTETVQAGTGATDIAVVRVASSNGRPGSVTNIGPMTWQSQAAGSGVRSATPNGQKTRITVRPQ